ncbi:MAG: oligogalacturonate lyase family protein [Ignavibacteriaceae bacterium]
MKNILRFILIGILIISFPNLYGKPYSLESKGGCTSSRSSVSLSSGGKQWKYSALSDRSDTKNNDLSTSHIKDSPKIGDDVNGYVGKIWQSEKRTWKDDSTGYEITQWTKTGTNWHLYFNDESFIDDSTAIFFSNRTGEINLFKLNLRNGEMIQMTEDSHIRPNVWHLKNIKTLWYLNGDTLKTLNTETLKLNVVYVFTDNKPVSFSVTCDAKYFVFATNKNPGYTRKCSTGPYAIFRLNLTTKELTQISPDYGFRINHILCNPVNPKIISYCWAHVFEKNKPGIFGIPPIRIWWLNIDGTNGGPVAPQEYGLHRTHEFWFPDGSMLGFTARYKFGVDKGKQFIGAANYKSGDHFMIPLNVEAAHPQIFSDKETWVTDLYNGQYLAIYKIKNRQLKDTRILFKHNSSWETGASEPCPEFSPDGKNIIFNTDRTGKTEVYTVRINLR